MKKLTYLLLLFVPLFVSAQQDAWVYFTNKPDAAYYLANPLDMLSQRALDRRAAQNISLDDKDVPISTAYIATITNTAGITVKAKSKWLNALHIRGEVTAIQNLENLAFVDRVEFADGTLNAAGKTASTKAITSVNKNLETQINFNYGNSQNQIQMLNGQVLHQQNYTGNGKIIAVLDAGFPGVNTAAPFQRLLNTNKILGGYDFVNRNANFYSGGNHGTLVLSTMGGYVENQLVGTAPDASYYLFITEDITSENPLEESNWVEAAEMADSLGVDIINSSLGYFGYDNPNYSHQYSDMNGNSTFVARGANIAFSRGMICVVSAGNSGATSNPHIATPADATNVLTIGAVTPLENYATFSSIGPSYDGRVKPDVTAQGQNAVISDAFGNIGTANGTSFSGPIIAGMIASFWQAFPAKTNAEIMQLVKQSSHLYANPTVQMGYGIPDFSIALNLNISALTAQKVQVYPNPVQNDLYFQLPTNFDKGTFMLYTNLGQKVIESPISANDLHVSLNGISSGIYFYKINSEGSTISGKLIKK